MIEVKALTKKYGAKTAVNGIIFSVSDGEVVGFLGPNGAGKTTTLNMLTGYIMPTDGDAFINGKSIKAEGLGAKSDIGYLPDTPPLYGDMTVIEQLNFVCELKKASKDKLDDIMEKVKISDVKNRLIKNLSKGYRQRVGLAVALVGEPKVLILDEPTVGLDPKQIIEVRDLIRSLKEHHTILLSSHILPEVSAICDKIVIINNGEIVASGTPDILKSTFEGKGKMHVRIKGEKSSVENAFANIPVTISFLDEAEQGCIDFTAVNDGEGDIREVIYNAAYANKLPLLMLKPYDVSLEDVFLKVTSNEHLSANIEETEQVTEEEQNDSDN